ncbi:MAG: hypothetical protein WDN04_10440 [Rhodospirillales bacterium]
MAADKAPAQEGAPEPITAFATHEVEALKNALGESGAVFAPYYTIGNSDAAINLWPSFVRLAESDLGQFQSAAAAVEGALYGVASAPAVSTAEQLAQQELYRDIDTTFARIEHKIASERTAMDALLSRLTTGST